MGSVYGFLCFSLWVALCVGVDGRPLPRPFCSLFFYHVLFLLCFGSMGWVGVAWVLFLYSGLFLFGVNFVGCWIDANMFYAAFII